MEQIETISVYLTPGASRNHVDKQKNLLGETVYKVSVKERPIDGKANAALVVLLADFLGVKKRQLKLVRGFTSRHKVVEVFF